MIVAGRRWPPAPTIYELNAIDDAAMSRQWTDGTWTARVEQQMAELTGAAHAVAFNSCTSAIHAALLALGAGRGTPVTCPAFSFAGTVTGAAHIAADLEFTDVDPGTLNGSPKASPGGVAIAVDLHGVPHPGPRGFVSGTPVLTDSCQSLGSLLYDRHVGWKGTHAWSFSSAKLVAAPDGGAVTTTDPDLAQALRELRDYGIAAAPGTPRANGPVVWRGGHNWRPSEITMALVSSRLRTYTGHAERARETAERLHDAFRAAGLWYQQPAPGSAPAWHKLRFGPPGWDRTECGRLGRELPAAGVPVHRWGAVPLHQHPAFARPGQQPLPVAESAAAGTLCLGTEDCPPLTWTDSEVKQISEAIKRVSGD